MRDLTVVDVRYREPEPGSKPVRTVIAEAGSARAGAPAWESV